MCMLSPLPGDSLDDSYRRSLSAAQEKKPALSAQRKGASRFGLLALVLVSLVGLSVALPSALAAQPAERVVWRMVPAGIVTLGDDAGRPEEKPAHQVSLPAFRVMFTEATVDQYATCHRAGHCDTPRGHSPASPEGQRLNWGAEGRGDHPINGVTWSQAQAFCAWAGGRLPTEAEWTRAAQKRERRRFPWGDGPPAARSPRLANLADLSASKVHKTWSTIAGYDDAFVGTAPVASFPMGRSATGALDMSGNLWEWTADRFDPEGYRRPKRAGAPNLRAARGGAFTSTAERATTQSRRAFHPTEASDQLGVRCVADAQASRKKDEAR